VVRARFFGGSRILGASHLKPSTTQPGTTQLDETEPGQGEIPHASAPALGRGLRLSSRLVLPSRCGEAKQQAAGPDRAIKNVFEKSFRGNELEPLVKTKKPDGFSG